MRLLLATAILLAGCGAVTTEKVVAPTTIVVTTTTKEIPRTTTTVRVFPTSTTTSMSSTTRPTLLVRASGIASTTTLSTTTTSVYAASIGWVWPWSCISHYESGGNPTLDTGNGYYGGLQFLLSTWYAHGGVGMPNQASIAEQEAIADNVVASDGGSYREWSTARLCGLS